MNKKTLIIVGLVLFFGCIFVVVAAGAILLIISNNDDVEIVENSQVWNGTSEYSAELFQEDTYYSGDVYMASCFESLVPEDYEITKIGFLPTIGLVKPVGPDPYEEYYPYIDIKFLDNSANKDLGEKIFSKEYKDQLDSLVPVEDDASKIISEKKEITSIKMRDGTRKAYLSSYEIEVTEPIQTYDGKDVNEVKAVVILTMGDNSGILVNFFFAYLPEQEAEAMDMFKNYLKTFEPTCYAKDENY